MRRRKVALHTISHLTPIEAWRKAVFTTLEGHRVLSEVRLENCTQVLGVGQIWRACDSRLRKNSASHLFWFVQTCLNLSKPVHNTVTMYALWAMPFLHFWMLLFFSITSYPAEMAYFNSPNRELSNGVWVMDLYWNRNVDPSRSPCLETVDRKSFEHRNFLVMHPVPLKIAYFKSANRQLSLDVRPNELR